MFYETRHYRTTEDGAAEFHAGFQTELLPLLEEHGFTLVGAWNVYVGEGSGADLIWMLRWPTLAAREQAFDAVRADPRNARFRKRHMKLLVSTSSTLLTPTAFSPMA